MRRVQMAVRGKWTDRGWLATAAVVLLLALALLAFGCGGEEGTAGDDTSSTEAAATSTSAAPTTETTELEVSELILASTTSTQDSGLFDELIPAFEAAYPQYRVKVIAVGTGEALKLGEEKAADVLLVHAPASEKEFVEKGFGTERREVMYNDFIIVGPDADPAGIKGTTDAAAALKKLSESGATFVSRGDDSGTHKKELSLWKAAGVEPTGSWYESAGQGMGEVLTIASEKGAYTLADRATYLSAKDNLDLIISVEGDKALFNQYGVIPVTEAGNQEGADAFAEWITSPEGQEVIGGFGQEEFGQPLFVPNAS